MTKTGVVAVAACAVACAGAAVVPGLLGGLAAGGALAALEAEAALVVLLALGGGAAYLWLGRRAKATCGCDEAAGCHAGASRCDLPDPKEPV